MTREKIAADWSAMFDNIMKARKRIVERHEISGKWAGITKCPQCNGKLHWSMARSNGHVHGQCETDNCLRWME